MTLLGVRNHGTGKLLLNPSLDYIMSQDDICYYIGFTREEYSKVGGATSISHALQGTCAKLAIYSMVGVGMDPYTLDEKTATDNDSVDHPVTFYIPGHASSEHSLNTDAHKNMETRHGLHLFKYLSDIEPAAHPVVKVTLSTVGSNVTLHHSGDNSSVGSSHDYHMRDGAHHYRKQLSEPLFKAHYRSHDHKPPLPSIRERTVSESSAVLKRFHSDTNLSPPADSFLYTSKLELVSSTQCLHTQETEHTLHSSRFHLPRPLVHHGRASVTSLHEEMVELEVNDLSEEAELEQLEDGICEDAFSNSRSPSPDPHTTHEHSGRPRYNTHSHITHPHISCLYIGTGKETCPTHLTLGLSLRGAICYTRDALMIS